MPELDGVRKVKFGDFAASVTDRVDDPASAGVDRYVGLEHLDPDSLKIARWGHPTEVEATKLRFRRGDIIFGRRRAYQRKLAVADFDGICSAHALVLRPNPAVALPRFLPLFMQSDVFFERALAISVGSLSPTINWRTLAAQEFELPSLQEQEEIADVLWSVEDALRAIDASIRVADEVWRATVRAKVAAPEHECRPLGDALVAIVAGRSFRGANEPVQDGEYGVLKVSAVGPEGFAPSENKRLLDQALFLPRFAVSMGDFLTTRANTRELVGRVCIVHQDAPNLMLSDKTLRLDLDHSKVVPEFLHAAMQSTLVRRQIEANATGTGGAMKNLSQPDFRALQVPLPKLGVQRRVVRILKAINETRTALVEHRKTTIQLRRSLMLRFLHREQT